MATVGQKLSAPESGWRRYDNTDSRFKYSSDWQYPNYTGYSSYDCYNSAAASSTVGTIIFKFNGSKLRIITVTWSDGPTAVPIIIDGTSYTMNGRGTNTGNILGFDIVLTPGNHTVQVNGVTGGTRLDAIDIDDTGYLMHPILNQVSSLSGIQIGDCIPARYTATTSGSFGSVSEIGTCIANEIPIAGSATPNGLFYLINVGYDSQNRIKFVADRNIQHSISWDTLNIAGIATGEGLLISSSMPKLTMRLPSGGIASGDTDNEWDKIIVSSTLNSKITAGDGNVWHWSGLYSWTSSTTQTDATSKTVRGNSAVGYLDKAVTSWVNVLGGFRPIILVELVSAVSKYLIQQFTDYYSIKPEYYEAGNSFMPLTLAGGSTPNTTDIQTFGFDDIAQLFQDMTVGTETFKPIDKLNNSFSIKLYKVK